MTFSYLLSPVISFALWMDHLIHSKNEFVILKPISHADSSLDFRIRRWTKPSFPENFCKFQLFLFCKATFALLTLSPYQPTIFTHVKVFAHVSSLLNAPPRDQAKALSLDGQNWQESCFPISTGSWCLRCCHQKQGKNTS